MSGEFENFFVDIELLSGFVIGGSGVINGLLEGSMKESQLLPLMIVVGLLMIFDASRRMHNS